VYPFASIPDFRRNFEKSEENSQKRLDINVNILHT
jgi:hypothetical protein